MQRARCCAANAYDATAAFHAVFGRAPTPRHLRRISSVCNELLHSQGPGLRRSYSTDPEDARQRDLGGSTADAPAPTDSRARKLAFYEEVMANGSLTKGMANEALTRREQRERKLAVYRESGREASTRLERPPEQEPKE